jgi:hypothetical protein
MESLIIIIPTTLIVPNLSLIVSFPLGSRLRPKTLQAVDVPVLESRSCEVWHKGKGINVIVYDEMMCAGYQFGGKDSCQGEFNQDMDTLLMQIAQEIRK